MRDTVCPRQHGFAQKWEGMNSISEIAAAMWWSHIQSHRADRRAAHGSGVFRSICKSLPALCSRRVTMGARSLRMEPIARLFIPRGLKRGHRFKDVIESDSEAI